MEKQKHICTNCGSEISKTTKVQKHIKNKFASKQKLAYLVVIVLAAFALEAVFLWAVSESRILHSPIQADLEIPIKKNKKKSDSLSAQLVSKVPGEEAQQANDSLYIPKLNVNSAVEFVGKTANGDMATSKSLYNVALYKDGAKPGENGSVVLAGHYGGPYERGVFRSADNLNEGDNIEYRFKDGRVIKYKVVSKATYKLAGMPLREIFNKRDSKYLNLITCYGSWDKATSTYDERLVVYAKQI